MKRKILIISAILISSFSHADSWESITKSTFQSSAYSESKQITNQDLAEVMYNGLPADFSHLIASVLPDHFQACVNVIMITRISVFVFDLKQKFLDYANKVI